MRYSKRIRRGGVTKIKYKIIASAHWRSYIMILMKSMKSRENNEKWNETTSENYQS